MFSIHKYEPKLRAEWDELIRTSKNGSVLFFRDYLEYHAERYCECSFVFKKKNRIVALIPGNIEGKIFYTHKYLTFGGIILSSQIYTGDLMLLFELLHSELKKLGITEVVYKAIPHIYHSQPAQEDLYILYRYNAQKIACQLSSAIYQDHPGTFGSLRKKGIKKALKAGVKVEESEPLDEFWRLLNQNLQAKYKTKAVHSLNEIIQLRNKFPKNIRLYKASVGEKLMAGVLVYVYGKVCHSQYIAVNQEGKDIGALDYLFDFLIREKFASIPVFDFGYSTEKMGEYLNENLIFQKEGFGARGVVYEIYKYTI